MDAISVRIKCSKIPEKKEKRMGGKGGSRKKKGRKGKGKKEKDL